MKKIIFALLILLLFLPVACEKQNQSSTPNPSVSKEDIEYMRNINRNLRREGLEQEAEHADKVLDDIEKAQRK